ncbi:MAG: RNA methyltransferase, partial [Anaerolineae bacterium]|nr:RNA methyltransferase [Anaerolineae bacterium]
MHVTRLYLVVLHNPVTDKHGSVVTTAPVGPDIHDIARSCATYGVSATTLPRPWSA